MSEIPNEKEYLGKAISVSVNPKLSQSIALAGLARHYFGGGAPVFIGGLLGYVLGSQTHISEDHKANVINEILTFRQRQQQNINDEQNDGPQSGGIMSSNELINHTYTKYNFTGKWNDFVGQPSKTFHAMIYGRPKQGKSILAVQFAEYLTNFGRVLYIASEEGFSVTLQKKVAEFAQDNPNLDFANYRNFEQIKEALHVRKYQFVFIDSVNFIKITPEDVEDLKAQNRGTAFITIQQATKNGNFRGSQEFAHNCDMVIRVEAGQASHQGRFQEPTEMAVFDKPEENANKKTPTNLGAENPQLELFTKDDFTEADF
jgi:predicted ATP-dependent serine protease